MTRQKLPPDRKLTEALGTDVAMEVVGVRRLTVGRSRYQTYEAWDTASPFGRLYRLDQAFMAAEGDEFIYHENLVFPGAMTHLGPRSALILGGGDGGSARRLLRLPGMDRILMVEMDAEVVRLARDYLAVIHGGSLDDPRVEICYQDALRFLGDDHVGERFDLILFDLTDPRGLAVPLYQPPFLRRCREALADGGILTLHTASPFFQPGRLRTVLEALRQVFPVVRPYFFPAPLYGGWWGMACASAGPDPAALSAAEANDRLVARGIGDLRYYNGNVHEAQFVLPNFLRDLLSSLA